MRWIHDNFKWGRPINNILFYFDNKFIPLDFLETYSINNNLPLPAYENCIKASHYFNLLDARGVIGVAQRQSYILKIRSLVKSCCEIYIKQGL